MKKESFGYSLAVFASIAFDGLRQSVINCYYFCSSLLNQSSLNNTKTMDFTGNQYQSRGKLIRVVAIVKVVVVAFVSIPVMAICLLIAACLFALRCVGKFKERCSNIYVFLLNKKLILLRDCNIKYLTMPGQAS